MSLVERQRAQMQAAMRSEIVDAAFAEFSERGYHQTSIADIAERLEIGHGTFYRYFKNKRDILDHVVDEVLAGVTRALAADNAPDFPSTVDEFREQALRIGRAASQIVQADPRVARLLLFESTSIDPELTDKILGLFDLSGQTAAAYLRNGVERGFLRADLDIESTGDAVTGLVLATTVRTLRSGLDDEGQRRFEAAVARVLIDGARA